MTDWKSAAKSSPALTKFSALDAVLEMMWNEREWDLESADAYPSFEAVRAVIVESRARGCSYFTSANRITVSLFERALREVDASGNKPVYQYVPGFLAGIWPTTIGGIFEKKIRSGLFGTSVACSILACGVSGLPFLERLDTPPWVLFSALSSSAIEHKRLIAPRVIHVIYERYKQVDKTCWQSWQYGMYYIVGLAYGFAEALHWVATEEAVTLVSHTAYGNRVLRAVLGSEDEKVFEAFVSNTVLCTLICERAFISQCDIDVADVSTRLALRLLPDNLLAALLSNSINARQYAITLPEFGDRVRAAGGFEVRPFEVLAYVAIVSREFAFIDAQWQDVIKLLDPCHNFTSKHWETNDAHALFMLACARDADAFADTIVDKLVVDALAAVEVEASAARFPRLYAARVLARDTIPPLALDGMSADVVNEAVCAIEPTRQVVTHLFATGTRLSPATVAHIAKYPHVLFEALVAHASTADVIALLSTRQCEPRVHELAREELLRRNRRTMLDEIHDRLDDTTVYLRAASHFIIDDDDGDTFGVFSTLLPHIGSSKHARSLLRRYCDDTASVEHVHKQAR